MKNIINIVVKLGVKVSFGVGVLLLSINIFGLFLTMRNPNIYKEQRSKIAFSEREFYKELKKIEELPPKEYVYAANRIVNQGIAHYWEDDAIKKYNLRVPVWENYIMYIRSFYNPSFLKYEFCNSRKAIERGVGMCSQQSLVLADILNKWGIETNLIRLGGHIVDTSLVDKDRNEWWVVDPDMGVVFEKDLELVEKDQSLVESAYRNVLSLQSYDKDSVDGQVKAMVGIYTSSEDNEIVKSGVSGYLSEGYCRSEKYDYILIWVIPVVLIFPFFLVFLITIGRSND